MEGIFILLQQWFGVNCAYGRHRMSVKKNHKENSAEFTYERYCIDCGYIERNEDYMEEG